MMTRAGRVGPLVALGLVLALGLSGCGDEAETSDDGVVVVATTTILGDIASNVVGDAGTVSVVMPLGADPHDFRASSQQVATMQGADLVVSNGLDLEEGLLDVLASLEADGVTVFHAADAVDALEGGHGEDDHEGDEGHEGEEGHEHEGLDPHIWMDPTRMAAVVTALGAELDAAHPGLGFAERAEAYATELEALADEIDLQLASIANRHLVTNHDSLSYFADRFDFVVVATVIPGQSTQGEASSSDLATLVETIEDEGVTAIFADNTDTTALAEAVAAEIGSAVAVVELFTGSLGDDDSGASTYIDMMRTNASRIAEALG